MASLNSWTLIGYAKYAKNTVTPTGKTKTTFQISMQEGTKEKPNWVRARVVAWENPEAQNLTDGEEVVVVGSYRIDEYQTKEGVKKEFHYCLARAVGRLKKGKIVSTTDSAPVSETPFGQPPSKDLGLDDDIPF